MITTLITVGIACLLASIIGGGFKGLGIEIPVLHSRKRQILLAVAGAVLLGSAAVKQYYPEPIDANKELMIGLETYDQGNFTNALPHFASAARRNNHEAEWHYGEMLYHGEGCVPDKKAGIRWIRRAAESGYAPAEASLGTAYANGDVIQKDIGQAKMWADRSAAQGDPWGLMVVAELETDSAKRLSELHESAAHGYAPAQNAIAQVLFHRVLAGDKTVVATELLKTSELLRKAAQQGVHNAQFTLAMLLSGFTEHKEKGNYTPDDMKSLETAYMWVMLALEPHDHRFPLDDKARNEGIMLRKELDKDMPWEGRLRVLDLAKAWEPTLELPYRHGHE
jgi:hypothetical protein